MSHGHFLKAFKEFGLKGTWDKLQKMRTLKFGQLVGTDKYGNEYYENRTDYMYGQHRWVVYAGDKNFYQVDSSFVPPEWHGWLHQTTDTPPTSTTVGSTHRVDPIKIAHGSSAPYKRNLGGVVSAPYPNLTQFRPRGYGMDNGIFPESKPGEELGYTQPGYPLDKRNAQRFTGRRHRMKFSLSDTPLTLQAKEAARVGLTIEEYQRVTDDDSPTKALLLLGETDKASLESLAAGGAGGPGEGVLMEAAAAIPAQPDKRALAVRLAYGLGPAGHEAGTFAAAASEVLSGEEEALLSAGADIEELTGEAAKYQRYIDDYADIQDRSTQETVADCVAKRDAALSKIKALKAISAKLEALAVKFDERALEAAKQAMSAQMR